MHYLVFLQSNVAEPFTAKLILPVVIFFALVVVITLIMSLLNMFKKPRAAKRFLVGLFILLIVFVIAWVLGNSDYFGSVENVRPGLVRMVHAGLLTTLILGTIGVILLLGDLLKGVFK